MAATLDVEENVSDLATETSPSIVNNGKVYLPWQFKPGAPGGPGRPKGVKNAEKAILRAAPYLAKQYIKRAAKSDAICIDARKWIMPTDEDSAHREDQRIFLFIGDGRTPMPADLPAPSLRPTPIDVTPSSSVETP